MPKLPDRWTAYEAVGGVIPGTRFIAFKVPLSDSFFTRRDATIQKFTPSDLVQQLGNKLGLVIDLTMTHRYYDPQEFQRHGINHKKIITMGKAVPSIDVFRTFAATVKSFENSAEKDMLIGVHCTHGINRTGYLICRYMIENMNFTPKEALKAFQKGRGYPIERPHYKSDLYHLSSRSKSMDWRQSAQQDTYTSPRRRIPNSREAPSQVSHQPYYLNGGYTNYHAACMYHPGYQNQPYNHYSDAQNQQQVYGYGPNQHFQYVYTQPRNFQNDSHGSVPYNDRSRQRWTESNGRRHTYFE